MIIGACRHCREIIDTKRVCACGKKLLDQCMECHGEVDHGRAPVVTDSPPTSSKNTVARQAAKRS